MAISKGTQYVTNPKTVPSEFKNVQEMKEYKFLKVGDIVKTLGYYEIGDGGGNDYEIVAAGTGTDDGGSYIDLSGSGLQAKGIFSHVSINAQQFGADKSGNSDSAMSINNAFIYLVTNGGGNLHVPSGEYLLNTILRTGSNTSLISESGVTFRKNHTASFLWNSLKEDGTNYTKSDDFPAYSGASNIVIDGGIWSGFSEGIYDGYTGFAIGYGSNITLKNITLLDSITGGHGIDLAGCRNVTIDNCKFLGQSLPSGTNPETVSSSTKEIIQIDQDVKRSFAGVYFNSPQFSPNINITIRNCVFDKNNNQTDSRFGEINIAIGSHGSIHNVWHENINIENCVFNNVRFAAIREWKWKNLTIDNCRFLGGARGLHCTATAEGSSSSQDVDRVQTNEAQHGQNQTITNCYFTGFSDAAIFTSSRKLTTNTDTRYLGVVIKGCHFYNMQGNMIRARQVRDFIISDCLMKDCSRTFVGIRDECEEVSVINNHLENGGGEGIAFVDRTLGSVVSGNIIKNVDGYPIYYAQNNDNFVISNNVISQFGNRLIVQSNSNNGIISNNRMSNPQTGFAFDYYISTSSATANVDILDNNFDDKTKYVLNQSTGGIARFVYDGNPEGVIEAGRGSMCVDGGGTHYIKRSTAGGGKTGWWSVDATSQ